MQTAKEYRSLEIFRSMQHWILRTHGQILVCFSWMRRTFRLQWQVFRQMDFQQPVSSGVIRSIAGKCTAIPVISGGSLACGTASNCMMWYVSITSVGLMSIFQSLMAVKQLHQDTGKKDRALNCSVRWSWHWANGKSLRKTLAI